MLKHTVKHSGSFKRLLLAASIAVTTLGAQTAVQAEVGYPEKEELKFGFIKLTDMAPLAIAYEKQYFETEGLSLQLEAPANWKVHTGWQASRWAQPLATEPRPILSPHSAWT